MRDVTIESYQERILRVLVYLQQHLDEALSLDDLARVACFSAYHFHRIFRGMVGESVMEHVRRLRLERAAQQLKLTDKPVTQIAFDAGYETHEAFTRAFRAAFGESPSSFRETVRPVKFPPSPSGVHYVADRPIPPAQRISSADGPLAVEVRKVETLRLAFMRHVGPYDQVGMTWGRLMVWASGRGLVGGGLRCFGVVHDDPDITPPEKLRYDAAIVVGADIQPEGRIGVQDIPGGDYAVARHRGPYDQLGVTYARLCGEWLPANGRELASAPALELYWNAPQMTRPEDLLTDIFMPLES